MNAESSNRVIFKVTEELITHSKHEIDTVLTMHEDIPSYGSIAKVCLDFESVEKLSNLHLGFLLEFLERAEQRGIRVGLINCSERIKSMLIRMCFDALFDIY